jgi:hypothetical protein
MPPASWLGATPVGPRHSMTKAELIKALRNH